MKYLKSIKSISAAQKNWYRVRGTRHSPELDLVAVWAVVSVAELSDDETPEYVEPDTVVGLPAGELGVSGIDPNTLTDCAGYVYLTPEEYEQVLEKPVRLGSPDLIWGD